MLFIELRVASLVNGISRNAYSRFPTAAALTTRDKIARHFTGLNIEVEKNHPFILRSSFAGS